MQRLARTLIARFSIGLVVLLVATVAPVSRAQEPPPDVGDVVVEQPLTHPGLALPNTCPTGRNQTQFVEEGWRFSVTGRCDASATFAGIGRRLQGLSFADGEVRLEMRAATAPDRASLAISVRVGPEQSGSYQAYMQPARGRVELLKFAGGQRTSLGLRTDLAGILSPDGWNQMAVRAQGSTLWVIVNDQPIIAATDSQHDSGFVTITLSRTGSPDDEQETSAIVRNLRISAIAGSEQARVPTYQAPAVAAPVPAEPRFVPPVGTPPDVGDVVREISLATADERRSTPCPTGRISFDQSNEGTIVKVRGKCANESTGTYLDLRFDNMTMQDGELRFEIRALSEADRAFFMIYVRSASNGAESYYANLALGPGSAFLGRLVGGSGSPLSQRTDLASIINKDDWNAVAIRLDGPNLWFLVNDRPVLSAADSALDGGNMHIRVGRLGNMDDDAEMVMQVRNFRLSTLAGGDPARVPVVISP